MAAPNRFVERLENGPPIVGDGGMGALVSSAVPRLRTPEEANLRAPDAVVSLHVGFIRAGAELIETNTFGANRRKLAGHYLEDEFEQIVSAGVRLAREAREVTGSNVFIGGSIGPLGDDSHVEERAGLFSEQASILEGRGADLFMLETFFDLDELVVAVEAVRERLEPADRRAAHVRERRGDPRRRWRLATPPTSCASWASALSARTTAPASRRRSERSSRWAATASRSPRCRTSASRAWPAAA